MRSFMWSALEPGYILHARTHTLTGRTIRRAIGSWGNHDSLAIFEDGWYSGDSEPFRAKANPLDAEYVRPWIEGEIDLRIYRPQGYTIRAGVAAGNYWMERIRGTPYDFAAFPRLLIKAMFLDIWQRPAGWEWAWYCTEGVRESWRNVRHHCAPVTPWRECWPDPWHKNNPTPRTTEKRVETGELEDVSDAILIGGDGHPCDIT